MRRTLLIWVLVLAGCEQPFSFPAPLARIILTPDTLTLQQGARVQLTATFVDSSGGPLAARPISWSSSVPYVAPVSPNGSVQALGEGLTIITATADGVVGSASIAVEAHVVRVSIDQGSQTLVPGGTLQLTATPRDLYDFPLAGRSVIWSSSSSAVATVSAAGLVTAHGAGAAQIVAASEQQTGSATVEVASVRYAALSAGKFAHTCGLTADGRAFCWGSDETEELGNEVAGSSVTPMGAARTLRFDGIGAGGRFTCGAVRTGTVYCWGYGGAGRLGDGTFDTRPRPVPVTGDLRFTTFAIGWRHSCGTTLAAGAYCWGGGEGLGGDAGKFAPIPQPLAGDPPVHRIEAGGNFSCGLTADSIAWCWGSNATGQLGSDAGTLSETPIPVSGGLSFRALASGSRHTCALALDGSAWCWGANGSGQLGNGSRTVARTPVAVSGGLTFTSITAGNFFSCGITATGAAYCWGDGAAGQLGSDASLEMCETGPGSTAPVAIAGGIGFRVLSAGSTHTCGLATSGLAYCWGDNRAGQVGDGTVINRSTPVLVAGQP
ncbi:MAG: Ig-like domain-containing protein [Gemmatimonadales bacterium]